MSQTETGSSEAETTRAVKGPDSNPGGAGESRARTDEGDRVGRHGPERVAGRAGCASTATRCPSRTRCWRDGLLVAEGFPVVEIRDYLAEPDTVVWLDLADPDPTDLEVLTDEFGLHPLAVEDAGHERQRPKLDRYSDHLFLSAYAVSVDVVSGRLVSSELSAFITGQALITVRKDDGIDVDALVESWDARADLAVGGGVGFLVHGLLDQIVDGHFDAVQTLDDEIEQLQDALFADAGPGLGVQRRTFELRKSLVLVRRVVLPMREVVNTLMRRDLSIIDEAMTPYLLDVYDHVLQVTEWTESLRDLVTTILETRLTIQGNRLNEIMKKLTAWAAIIAVPTAVTGFYGQNIPYPGFGQEWGVVASIALIIAIAGGLYATFKRNDWL